MEKVEKNNNELIAQSKIAVVDDSFPPDGKVKWWKLGSISKVVNMLRSVLMDLYDEVLSLQNTWEDILEDISSLKKATSKIAKLEEEVEEWKGIVEAQTKLVEDYTELLSSTLEDVESKMKTIFDVEAPFKTAEETAMELFNSSDDLLTNLDDKVKEETLKGLDKLEEQINLQPAIGSKGMKARHQAQIALQEKREKLKGQE